MVVRILILVGVTVLLALKLWTWVAHTQLGDAAGRIQQEPLPIRTAQQRQQTLSTRPAVTGGNFQQCAKIWAAWPSVSELDPRIEKAIELPSTEPRYVALNHGDQDLKEASLGLAKVKLDSPATREKKDSHVTLEFWSTCAIDKKQPLIDKLEPRAFEVRTSAESFPLLWVCPAYFLISLLSKDAIPAEWQKNEDDTISAFFAEDSTDSYSSLKWPQSYELSYCALCVRLQCRNLRMQNTLGIQATTHLRILPASQSSDSISIDINGNPQEGGDWTRDGKDRMRLEGLPVEVTTTSDWFEWQLTLIKEGTKLLCSLALVRPPAPGAPGSNLNVLRSWRFSLDAGTQNLIYHPELQNFRNESLELREIAVTCIRYCG